MKEQKIPPSDSAHHEQVIQLFLRRLASLLTLKYSLTLAALWCFAWGTFALAMRAGLGTSRKVLLWGAGGILIAITVAVVKASAAAVLDPFPARPAERMRRIADGGRRTDTG
jgi:hypothetical protein